MDVGDAPLSQFDREVSQDLGIGTVGTSLHHYLNVRFAQCIDVTAHDQLDIAS